MLSGLAGDYEVYLLWSCKQFPFLGQRNRNKMRLSGRHLASRWMLCTILTRYCSVAYLRLPRLHLTPGPTEKERLLLVDLTLYAISRHQSSDLHIYDQPIVSGKPVAVRGLRRTRYATDSLKCALAGR